MRPRLLYPKFTVSRPTIQPGLMTTWGGSFFRALRDTEGGFCRKTSAGRPGRPALSRLFAGVPVLYLRGHFWRFQYTLEMFVVIVRRISVLASCLLGIGMVGPFFVFFSDVGRNYNTNTTNIIKWINTTSE